jgi:hypothetical protein
MRAGLGTLILEEKGSELYETLQRLSGDGPHRLRRIGDEFG